MATSLVRVFRLAGFDRRQHSKTHGKALYRPELPARPAEANVLVMNRCAVWRGRGQKQITLLIPTHAFVAFLGMMRYRGRPESAAIDSRTHKFLGGLRGYQHVRNLSYSGLADDLIESVSTEDRPKNSLEEVWQMISRDFSEVFV